MLTIDIDTLVNTINQDAAQYDLELQAYVPYYSGAIELNLLQGSDESQRVVRVTRTTDEDGFTEMSDWILALHDEIDPQAVITEAIDVYSDALAAVS